MRFITSDLPHCPTAGQHSAESKQGYLVTLLFDICQKLSRVIHLRKILELATPNLTVHVDESIPRTTREVVRSPKKIYERQLEPRH